MKYTIIEECDDGRTHCLIERADGSTYGQLVDLRLCANAAEVDAAVLEACEVAEQIEQATQMLIARGRQNAVAKNAQRDLTALETARGRAP